VHAPILSASAKSSKGALSWNIQELQKHVGEDVCRNIIFIHAFLGCDSTSKPYGVEKGAGLKLYDTNLVFRYAATVFNMTADTVSKESVILSGEQALVSIYKGVQGQTLNSVRLSAFYEKIAQTSVYVDPKQLPPTADAAKFHSLRVYL